MLMTDDDFWEIIEQARLKAAGKSSEEHAQALIDEIAKLSIKEIMELTHEFDQNQQLRDTATLNQK